MQQSEGKKKMGRVIRRERKGRRKEMKMRKRKKGSKKIITLNLSNDQPLRNNPKKKFPS